MYKRWIKTESLFLKTLFLQEAEVFHNLSTHNSQTYPLTYPQPYPQDKFMPLKFARSHESHG